MLDLHSFDYQTELSQSVIRTNVRVQSNQLTSDMILLLLD